MKYVIYTSDKSAVDAAFNSSEFNSSPLFKAKIAESGNHRVAVFSAANGCFIKAVKPLFDSGLIEFLGCEETDACCRDNPSKHFTEDDKAKVTLANAWGLF